MPVKNDTPSGVQARQTVRSRGSLVLVCDCPAQRRQLVHRLGDDPVGIGIEDLDHGKAFEPSLLQRAGPGLDAGVALPAQKITVSSDASA